MSTRESTPSSRRALLAAAAGGAAALLVDSLARPLPARAHDPDDVLLGGVNESTSTTTLRNMSGAAVVLMAESVHGSAIDARSDESPAILAVSNTEVAISAVSKQHVGVAGYGGEPDAAGWTSGGSGTTGVMGKSGAGYGVAGMSRSGEGVHASSETGSGVYAYSPTGWGLDARSDSGMAVRAVCLGGTAIDATTGSEDPAIAAVDARHEQGDAVRGWSRATGVHGITEGSFDWEGNRDVVGVFGISRSVDGFGGNGIGVEGRSETAIGVYGHASAASGDATGVLGRSSSADGTGVSGQSTANSTGLLGHSRLGRGMPPTAAAKTGVYGYANQDASAKGVYGRSTVGAGGYFSSTTGYALRSSGRVRFEKSAGLATIAATSNKVTVTPGIDLTAGSKVLATLQTSPGGTTTVHRVVRDIANDTFTIYLTAPATQRCTVAWFVIS